MGEAGARDCTVSRAGSPLGYRASDRPPALCRPPWRTLPLLSPAGARRAWDLWPKETRLRGGRLCDVGWLFGPTDILCTSPRVDTYDHRPMKIDDPVRSRVLKHWTGRLVV